MAGHLSCRALPGEHPLYLTGAPRSGSRPPLLSALTPQARATCFRGKRARSCLSPAGPGRVRGWNAFAASPHRGRVGVSGVLC